ncbi:MAG: hypothetical protein ACJ76H_02430 [Bacteriovoracaceae bacterium]
MKSKHDEQTQRILILLKIDANNLYTRIKERKNEYLEIFALRRTRAHFPKIFNNRYEATPLHDLSHCGPELIALLDQYYTMGEEMSWYLFATEDMPGTVEAFVDRKIRKMGKLLETLNLFIDAELGTDENPEVPQPTENYFFDEPVEETFPETPSDDTSSQEP